LSEAQPYLEWALAICERGLGLDLPNTQTVYRKLVSLLAELNDES
jgi:hypothetical protein